MDKIGFEWNDDRLKELKDMLSKKIPYNDIASHFNITRGAVNRAVTRYGLAGHYHNGIHQVGDENANWIVTKTYRDGRRTMVQCICKCGCGEIYDVRNDNFDRLKKICQKQKDIIAAEKAEQHVNRESYKTRLIGRQFGNLLVVDFDGYNKNKQILYKCECQCEAKTIVSVTYSDLVSGKKDNCGCLTKQKMVQAKRKYNTYNLDGDYGIGWTTNTNREFWFDKEDFDLIKNYCWTEHDGYVMANGGNRTIVRLHRLIMGVTDPAIKVDHIHHDTFDNRKSELRVATNQEKLL